MKWIVIEVQMNSDGTMGLLTYDYDNREDALSKYYYILSFAAKTQLPSHGAMIVTSDCKPVAGMNAVFHYVAPEPEPEPEPEVEE